MQSIKIGRTSFNPEAIKAMTYDEFFATFKGKLDIPADVAYFKITGVKPDVKAEARTISAKTEKVKRSDSK